jgi:hypothetical protein
MSDRFSDRDEIFPEHLLSSPSRPFSVYVYYCEDGAIVHVEDAGEGSPGVSKQFVARPDVGIGQVLRDEVMGESSIEGMFVGYSPDESLEAYIRDHPHWRYEPSSGSPGLRMGGSFGFAGRGLRKTYDFQVWWKRYVEEWAVDKAQRLAIRDVQEHLLAYALYRPGFGRPSRVPLSAVQMSELQEVLDKYEQLISKPKVSEGELQRFLQDNPTLLSPTYEEVIPLQQLGVGKEMETDFVIRVSPGEYLIVEIEKPSTRLVTRGSQKKKPDIHSELTHAEGQMIHFIDWVNEHVGNMSLNRKLLGIRPNPHSLLVAGIRRDLDGTQLEVLDKKKQFMKDRYTLMTFDQLLERGKLLLKTMRRYERA